VVLPKIAWTWWVLIGSLVTCAVGYSASLLFPEPIHVEEVAEG
jgi:hypothetical protein